MPAPPNTTAATALALGTLPSDVAVDLSAVPPGGPLSLWFRYQAREPDVVASVWATMGAFDDYGTTIWVGTPGALIGYLAFTGTFGPIVVPVTPGVTYWIEVALEAVPPAPPALQLSVLPGPHLTAPAGALLINDDNPDYPSAILSPTDGTVLQYRRLPAAGETAAMLRDGRSLWEETLVGSPTTLRLYDATLTRTASPVVPGRLELGPIASNRIDRFYVAVEPDTPGGTTLIRTISAAGVTGPTTWHVPARRVLAIDVSPDETVLYYVAYETSVQVPAPVQRWNLTTDTALSDLAAAVPDYSTHGVFGREMAVLPDGSVLVPYTSASDAFVRRYAASGTLLHTYALGAVQVNRVTHDVQDEAGAFWVWSFPLVAGVPGDVSRFQLLQVSDGAVRRQFETPIVTLGAVEGAGVTLGARTGSGSAARFGTAESCPFLALPMALLPGGGGDGGGGGGGGGGDEDKPPHVAPSYHLDERYIRRLRRAPHVAQENRRTYLRRFELDLERGQGAATGAGSAPVVLLRISRDGGQTWGEEVRMAAPRLGDYTARVRAERLGSARDTVLEVTVSDPIAWALVQAWIDVEPGTA